MAQKKQIVEKTLEKIILRIDRVCRKNGLASRVIRNLQRFWFRRKQKEKNIKKEKIKSVKNHYL